MSQTFVVEATRSRRWWVLECTEAPSVSQCRTLAEAADEMRPLIADRAGLAEDEVEIDVRVIVPEVIQGALSEVERLREESRRANAEAAARSRQVVAELRAEGLTLDDIGRILGVSKGRVSQLANAS
ncbi:Sigma-70, region 4 [Ruaniaceae bacterium KH17]|nr:Sigma-70, region 4 [Ruaniaceae bacterium KH17]